VLAGGRLKKGAPMKQEPELSPERSATEFERAGSRRVRTHLTEERNVAIKLEDGSLIRGKINICAEPAAEYHDLYLKHNDGHGTFFKRASDIFTRGKNPFIVVYDATIEGQPGRVLIINKNKILWISPED
jgi:hypothetical protein